MNRLARERSPYLLQHANNPVDWYPWGDEAFAKARAENKPIFLSVGYSTCHWCHVMEHESFENPNVANVLNSSFVSIKVDREERPDVDRVYMMFVQRSTGAGGWPMSVWLTPELKPFYGGTYFPPDGKWGRPGFTDILQEIARVWAADSSKVTQSADAVTEQLKVGDKVATASAVPSAEALTNTLNQFRSAYDRAHGGFGDAPKFPRPSELFFLLREHARTGSAEARDMVLRTLAAMALGGMRDHIGGGFHRYSVDGAWRVPHFEKMLYDQAQLVLALLEAAQASGDPFFIEVAEDTLRYVMREMTGEEGGFYSAEDADSLVPGTDHKSEGAFYLWSADQVDALLGDDAALVKKRFGIEPDGNAPFDPQGEFTGKNLLYAAASIDDLAAESNVPSGDVSNILSRARLAMFRARLDRPRPHLDDKVLTAWNGLMIAAFARAARLLTNMAGGKAAAGDAYRQAARNAAGFIQARMWDESSRTLRRRFRDGNAAIDAYAEDYAFLIFGLVELFEADPDRRWLEWAVLLQNRQDELFWDDSEGGWFSTTGTDASVLVRMKEEYDGAEPGASSIAVLNLLALSHLIELPGAAEKIERTFKLFGARLEQLGRAVPMMAAALSAYTAGPSQLVIVGGSDAGDLARAAADVYAPFSLQLRVTAEQQRALATVLPLIAEMKPLNGHATAYVCRNFACQAPITSDEALEAALRS